MVFNVRQFPIHIREDSHIDFCCTIVNQMCVCVCGGGGGGGGGGEGRVNEPDVWKISKIIYKNIFKKNVKT